MSVTFRSLLCNFAYHPKGVLMRYTKMMSTLCGLLPATILLGFVATPAQSQTYSKIYDFYGGAGGAYPYAGLVIDRAGNFYGTTVYGGLSGSPCGSNGCGTVFKLALRNANWIFTPLYKFQGGNDGFAPYAPLTIGPDGTLYGTTSRGGPRNSGTVFNLRPPASNCAAVFCPWAETVVYNFAGGDDGANPGAIVFDSQGVIYGAAAEGGAYGYGVVYKLVRLGDNWTQTVVYPFNGISDGGHPASPVIFDDAGNLYGTTLGGNYVPDGTVYELTPSGSNWVEKTLHIFQGTDGEYPYGGLVFDPAGNLYGATPTGAGDFGGGTAYQLAPSAGSWTFTVISSFGIYPETGPYDSLIIDLDGNLYGTTVAGGGFFAGSAFELTPMEGTWSQIVLHAFTGGWFGSTDGSSPYGSLVFDSSGDLYGTTSGGGVYGYGTVFQIGP